MSIQDRENVLDDYADLRTDLMQGLDMNLLEAELAADEIFERHRDNAMIAEFDSY